MTGVIRKGWRVRRCGSVFTAVVDGQSRYGVIDKFIQSHTHTGSCGTYAVVRWFCKQTYPTKCVLVAHIRDWFAFDDSLSSVVSINDIDPSRVVIELVGGIDYGGMYLMRIEGWDTVEHEDL